MNVVNFLFPEWQGFGSNNQVYHGALAMHQAFEHFGNFVAVDLPQDEHLRTRQGILGHDAILRNIIRAQEILQRYQPDRIFMIGGTCASEMAPVAYLNRRYQGNMTVIWFDAHGDLNTPDSSPTGRFHGMVLRTLLGEGDASLTKQVLPPLRTDQVILAGVRDLDLPEADFIREKQMPCLSVNDLDDPGDLLGHLDDRDSSRLYIHLDLDILDPGAFRGAQVECPGGVLLDGLITILKALDEHFDIVGLSLVEYASRSSREAARIATALNQAGLGLFGTL